LTINTEQLVNPQIDLANDAVPNYDFSWSSTLESDMVLVMIDPETLMPIVVGKSVADGDQKTSKPGICQ
jgi:hypothetical protein